MKRYYVGMLACVLLVAASAQSCKEAPFISLDTPTSVAVPFEGGPVTISFSVNRTWSASYTGDWCSLPQSSGEGGDISLVVDVAPNPDPDARSCKVSVSSEGGSFEISLRQAKRPTVIPSADRVDLSWNDNAFTLSTQFSDPYQIRIEGDWLACAGTRSLSVGQESFIVESNRSLNERTAMIYMENEGMSSAITVVQGSYTHKVLEETEPGFYGFDFGDIVYVPGLHQIGVSRFPSSKTFRILGPQDGLAAEVSGIPDNIQPEGSFPGGVSIIRDAALVFSKKCDILVLKTSDNLVWCAVNDECGLIARI